MDGLIAAWIRLTAAYRNMSKEPTFADYAVVVPGVALATCALAMVAWASYELVGDHLSLFVNASASALR
jgi:hypothetical protein